MKTRLFVTVIACMLVCMAVSPVHAFHFKQGAVYTMTNNPDGNEIVVFSREFNGSLNLETTVSTDGLGSGGGLDPLTSQGSITMTKDQKWLLAVNAGSNEISVFRIHPDGLDLVDKVSSGGVFPTSLTIFHGLVYVLNNGSPNIAGFTLSHSGDLTPIADSTRTLDGNAFSQVSFDSRGERLIITDRGNQQILVFSVGEDGTPGATPVISNSEGAGPFGFIVDKHNHLVVSEAGAGAASSYDIQEDGTLETVSASVTNDQIASCWIAANQLGHVFISNTGSNTLSSYQLFPRSGALYLREKVAGEGDSPVDLDITPNGRYLYVLNAGSGTVGMFKITIAGSLVDLGTVEGPLEIYAQGMVAR